MSPCGSEFLCSGSKPVAVMLNPEVSSVVKRLVVARIDGEFAFAGRAQESGARDVADHRQPARQPCSDDRPGSSPHNPLPKGRFESV